MQKILLKTFIAAAAVFLIYFAVSKLSCSTTGLVPEITEVSSVQLYDLDSSIINLNIQLKTKNRNNFSITAEKLIAFLISGKDTIGNAYRESTFSFKAGETSSLTIDAELKTEKVIEILNTGVDTLKINLYGRLNSKTGLANIPVDFDIPLEIPLKEKLEKTIEDEIRKSDLITVKSALLKSADLGESEVEILFTLTNPYNIELDVLDYPSTLKINNETTGSGNITRTFKIAGKDNITEARIIYKLNNLKTALSLFRSVLKKKIEYETNGILKLSFFGFRISIPYNFHGVLVQL